MPYYRSHTHFSYAFTSEEQVYKFEKWSVVRSQADNCSKSITIHGFLLKLMLPQNVSMLFSFVCCFCLWGSRLGKDLRREKRRKTSQRYLSHEIWIMKCSESCLWQCSGHINKFILAIVCIDPPYLEPLANGNTLKPFVIIFTITIFILF